MNQYVRAAHISAPKLNKKDIDLAITLAPIIEKYKKYRRNLKKSQAAQLLFEEEVYLHINKNNESVSRDKKMFFSGIEDRVIYEKLFEVLEKKCPEMMEVELMGQKVNSKILKCLKKWYESVVFMSLQGANLTDELF